MSLAITAPTVRHFAFHDRQKFVPPDVQHVEFILDFEEPVAARELGVRLKGEPNKIRIRSRQPAFEGRSFVQKAQDSILHPDVAQAGFADLILDGALTRGGRGGLECGGRSGDHGAAIRSWHSYATGVRIVPHDCKLLDYADSFGCAKTLLLRGGEYLALGQTGQTLDETDLARRSATGVRPQRSR